MLHDPALSNSLTDLAARFRIEHRACMDSMRDSVAHAIAAGEILIEAKQQLNHGHWLPWLKEHCGDVAERTAQLYMRAAKNCATIEDEIRNAVADLSLNEAMALLALSSDVRKLLTFIKQADPVKDPDAFLQGCIDNGIAVLPGYDPFHGIPEAEKIEWHVFMLWLMECQDYAPDTASDHVRWILRRPFSNVDEWLGPEGAAFRLRVGMGSTDPEAVAWWQEFAASHRDKTLKEIGALLAEAEKRWKPQRKRRKRRRN